MRPALTGLALLLSTAVSGCVDQYCGAVGCPRIAELSIVDQHDAISTRLSPGMRVHLCINARCSEALIGAYVAPAPSTATSLEGDLDGKLVVAGIPHEDPDVLEPVWLDYYGLNVSIELPFGQAYVNGDVYTADVFGMDGTILLSRSWTATYSYEEINGPGCGGCIRAALTPM